METFSLQSKNNLSKSSIVQSIQKTETILFLANNYAAKANSPNGKGLKCMVKYGIPQIRSKIIIVDENWSQEIEGDGCYYSRYIEC